MSMNSDRANDPVCGISVDKATAIHAERAGETFHFCSDECRQKFLASFATAEPADTAGCNCE